MDLPHNIESIYEQLGCTCFDCIPIDHRNYIYVDDEGLLTMKLNSTGFIYKDSTPLIGNGLIQGVDRNTGDSISTSLTVEEVRKNVRFVIFPGKDG